MATTLEGKKTGLHIAKAHAENYKKIKVIDLTPGSANTIGGKNRQGKTSFLDALSEAIGGAKLASEDPIRHGQDFAEIEVNLTGTVGDMPVSYKVVRKFRRVGDDVKTELTITSPDGATLGRPQQMLDNLLGKAGTVTLDPSEFYEMKPEVQASKLRELVGIDFTDLDAERKRVYDDRKLVNAQIKQLESRLTGRAEVPNTPAEEVSAEDLNRQLAEAQFNNDNYQKAQSEVRRVSEQLAAREAEVKRLEDALHQAKLLRSNSINDLAHAEEYAKKFELIETSPIVQRIGEVETINRAVRQNAELFAGREEYRKLEEKRVAANKRMDEIDALKEKALADAVLPIDGLKFAADKNAEGEITDSYLTYEGSRLADASSSERIRVATAIALAMAGDIKVVLVRQAAFLDEDGRAEMIAQAEAAGAQIFMELVGAQGDLTLCIEDGEASGSTLGI